MGWSEAQEILRSADHYIESNYVPTGYATWFQRSWWTLYDWGWIYTNDTAVPVKLKTATFSACAGHSNNKPYWGGGYNADGSKSLLYTYGYGCTFTSDIYVVDSSGVAVGKYEGVGTCDIPSISTYNCAYGGLGNTSTDTQNTSFGNPNYFAPPLCRMDRTITYTDPPVVPPGGKMFVVIRPTAWKGQSEHSLLVMVGDSSTFRSELETENNDYIWIFKKKKGDTEPKWYKEQVVRMKVGNSWKKM